ncbi:hypothetical protein [Tropicimonas sp. S265A]|uniref:hypothetical protein n=1 Tax=Tropicimonas sp. S265A TaxID=3415134 RepID=UPI003C7A3CD2
MAYADSADEAISVQKDLVAAHPTGIKTPEPQVFVGQPGASPMNSLCRLWCMSQDYWVVCCNLRGQAKARFDELGISIPFP